MVLLSACSTAPRSYAPPKAENYAIAEMEGFQDIRSWGDSPAPYLEREIPALRAALADEPGFQQRVDILALSGGAEDGAYGAGFLTGWSDRGDRPEFYMVTGISTGALMAPFAFLGPEYDVAIQRLFTESSKDDIVSSAHLSILFGGAALGDSAPLRRLIHERLTDELVAAIARESRRGRVLLIGTTELHSQRPVTWDIGRIAESGHPDAKRLIGDVILASASIPGMFPPVIFEVLIDGERYHEVHVDGGVTNQIFVYPRNLDIAWMEEQLGISPEKHFWLIRNTKIDPEFKPVELSIGDLANRSISTLIKYQGRGDLINIMDLADRDGFNLHFTNVPADFNEPLNDLFDPVYMKRLYEVGYRKGLSESAWHSGFMEIGAD